MNSHLKLVTDIEKREEPHPDDLPDYAPGFVFLGSRLGVPGTGGLLMPNTDEEEVG